MARGFSNLNLNGTTPIRVQPNVGEWGPQKVSSTRRKWWGRTLAVIAFILAFSALLGWAIFIYFKYLKG
ncbi:MAG: hypothetical protein ACRDAX_02065 [Propionibacteriaceae bacterium]